MFMRAMAAATLILSFVSGAQASSQHGVRQRISCAEVRCYVAKYSAATAELYARSRGATEAQINAARRCLKDQAAQALKGADL